MMFCSDIHGAQRIHWNLRDPLTFHHVPPAGQTFIQENPSTVVGYFATFCVKYLTSYLVCHLIWYKHSWSPEDVF